MSADEPILARLQRYLDDTQAFDVPPECNMGAHRAVVELCVLQKEPLLAIEALERVVNDSPLYASNASVVRVSRSARLAIHDVGKLRQESDL